MTTPPWHDQVVRAPDDPYPDVLSRAIRARIDGDNAVASMPPDLAGPEHINYYERSHWVVENRLHWVRDVTFHEDS